MIDKKTLAKDIRIELGDPVVVVELADEQIEHCIDRAVKWAKNKDITPLHVHDLSVHRYASAMAKLILGRVRSKYAGIPTPSSGEITDGPQPTPSSGESSGEITMDGPQLVTDASSEFLHLGAGPFG